MDEEIIPEENEVNDETLVVVEEELSGQEQLFEAAATGKVSQLKELIERRHELGVDFDGRNEEGFTALQIGVTEGYGAFVNELLKLRVHIGDALLRAVDVEYDVAVKSIIEYADNGPEEDRERIINCHCEGSDFHPLLTPIMLAAQKNNFTIVKMLLDAGARIPETKRSSESSATIDSLLQSVGLVEQYSALASPAYVTQAFSDPIDKAFQLTKTLMDISFAEVEHKLVFQEMAGKMERLAAELISHARNTKEILTVLKYSERNDNGKTKTKPDSSESSLPKISRAIQYQQKKFIAEPNCQQAIGTQFRKELIVIGEWSDFSQLAFFLGIVLSHPILSILFKFGTAGKFADYIQTPYVKYVMQLGSDVALLVVLVAKTFFDSQSDAVLLLEVCILMVYSLGMAAKIWRYVKCQGAKKYFSKFASYRDILIASLLFVECIMEAVIISKTYSETQTHVAERPWTDVDALVPAILALVTVVAFMRVMPYLATSDLVGAFQISLGDMVVNTSHFFVILLGVFIAFATGITFLFKNSAVGTRDITCTFRRGDCSNVNVRFANIWYTSVTLYWSMFGLIGTDTLQLPEEQRVMYLTGILLFALFHVLAILVLLNALIAIMSNVYNAVEANADVEWKYSRSVLWMSFMDDMFIVPPPYNLLPDLRKVFRSLKRSCSKMNNRPIKKEEIIHRNNVTPDQYQEMQDYEMISEGDYEVMISQLMERYVGSTLTTEQSAVGGIGPGDIRDLRNDISTLRFDITVQLGKLEDDIDQGRSQSRTIHDQSVEANTIFSRTLEIDAKVDKYRTVLQEISQNVDKYSEFVPALSDMDAMIDFLLDERDKKPPEPPEPSHVPSLVRRYEQGTEASSARSRSASRKSSVDSQGVTPRKEKKPSWHY